MHILSATSAKIFRFLWFTPLLEVCCLHAQVNRAEYHRLNTKLTVKTNWVKEAGFTGFKLTREWLTDLVILNVCFVCLFVRVLHANVMQSIMSHFALSDFELETQALLIIFSPGCSFVTYQTLEVERLRLRLLISLWWRLRDGNVARKKRANKTNI